LSNVQKLVFNQQIAACQNVQPGAPKTHFLSTPLTALIHYQLNCSPRFCKRLWYISIQSYFLDILHVHCVSNENVIKMRNEIVST